METTKQSSSPVVTKETKNRISVDYEGKLSVKERLMKKLSESNTWIKAGVNVLRFVFMLGISFVIIYPFIARIAGSFMTYEDVIDSTVAIIPKNPTLEIYKAIAAENHYFEALLAPQRELRSTPAQPSDATFSSITAWASLSVRPPRSVTAARSIRA